MHSVLLKACKEMNVKSIVFKETVSKKLPFILSNGHMSAIIYTVFTVITDSVLVKKELWLELENQPEKALKGILADALKRKFAEKCENIDEAYQMFWKVLPDKPYSSVDGLTQFR